MPKYTNAYVYLTEESIWKFVYGFGCSFLILLSLSICLNACFSKKPPDDTLALAPLFGPPLESAFDEQKTEGRELYVYSTALELLLSSEWM